MDLPSSPLLQPLLERYEQLESRDRLAVNGLAAFLALLLLYLLVWSPANVFYENSQENLGRRLSVLQFMRSTESQARAVGGGSREAAVTSGTLLPTVSRAAQEFGIKPSRLQPEGADGVSVWFNEVGFNELVAWLQSISAQGISVRQISIDREEQAGTVNARIILRT